MMLWRFLVLGRWKEGAGREVMTAEAEVVGKVSFRNAARSIVEHGGLEVVEEIPVGHLSPLSHNVEQRRTYDEGFAIGAADDDDGSGAQGAPKLPRRRREAEGRVTHEPHDGIVVALNRRIRQPPHEDRKTHRMGDRDRLTGPPVCF